MDEERGIQAGRADAGTVPGTISHSDRTEAGSEERRSVRVGEASFSAGRVMPIMLAILAMICTRTGGVIASVYVPE